MRHRTKAIVAVPTMAMGRLPKPDRDTGLEGHRDEDGEYRFYSRIENH